jgi:hypothetical protein
LANLGGKPNKSPRIGKLDLGLELVPHVAGAAEHARALDVLVEFRVQKFEACWLLRKAPRGRALSLPRMPRADEPPTPPDAGDDLQHLLQGARLGKYHAAMGELGAECVADLEDVTTEQLRGIGFKELEINRLRKAIAATAGEAVDPRGSLLVKPRRGSSRTAAAASGRKGELSQDLLGSGRSSVSDFASLQRPESKLSKKCLWRPKPFVCAACCCTRTAR